LAIIDFLIGVLNESYSLFASLSPYLILGFLIAGILYAWIPQDFIIRHLSGRGLAPVVKASIFGVPIPLCSCGVIPVAASLRKQGASKASTLSFLVSTPTTGIDSILATYSLLGPLFALMRPLSALFAGISVGAMTDIFVEKEKGENHVEAHHHLDVSISNRLQVAISYGFSELVSDIGKWIIVGVLLGGLIGYAVPGEFISKYLSHPLLSFLLMLFIGVPMYVCATGSIPIVASLIAKGMNPGAALVFLIAGPATNTVTMTVVARVLGRRALFLYLFSVVGISILSGLVFNFIYSFLGSPFELIKGAGEGLPSWVLISSSILLGFLILRVLLIDWSKKRKEVEAMKMKFRVPDMSCEHCKRTIEDKIRRLEGVKEVLVNLDEKLVLVDFDGDKEKVAEAIKQAGYTPVHEAE